MEKKNLKYSNFKESDVDKHKAKILGERYGFKYKCYRIINPSQFEKADLIILAVDNPKIRELVYNSKKDWIDCRSKGKTYSNFVKDKKNVPELDMERKEESCQNEDRLEINKIDAGNLISASIGMARLLDYDKRELTQYPIIGRT